MNRMTPEELSENYQFNVAKKLLMKKYPWVKDVKFNSEELNDYSLIFLTLSIDPWELARKESAEVSSLLRRNFSWMRTASFLNIFFAGDMKYIENEIQKTLDSIHNSPALPKEMRLPQGRKFSVLQYEIDDNAKFDEEVTQN